LLLWRFTEEVPDTLKFVMPAKAGIQHCLDKSGYRFHGKDGKGAGNRYSATR